MGKVFKAPFVGCLSVALAGPLFVALLELGQPAPAAAEERPRQTGQHSAIGSGDTTVANAPDANTANAEFENEIRANQYEPDNTGRNVRDRGGSTQTPFDQAENPADRELTRRIRRAIVKDEALSSLAHNIKIISADGTVTLRGPVKTDVERRNIVAAAQEHAGSSKVIDQLDVRSE